MLSLLITCFVLIPGALAGQYCRQYSSYYSTYYTTYYCSGYCCGSLYDKDCCGGSSSVGDFSIGRTIGLVISGIVGFIILVSIIVCIVKVCTKSGSHGRVVYPRPDQPNVVVVNSGYGPGPSSYPVRVPGAQPVAPPPYSVGGYPYPGPATKQNPNVALGPAYPPNGAGPSSAQGQPTYPPPNYAPPPGPLSTPVAPPTANGPPPSSTSAPPTASTLAAASGPAPPSAPAQEGGPTRSVSRNN